MSMINNTSTRSIFLAALAASFTLAACGDDAKQNTPADAKVTPNPDAPNPDAAPPDAAPVATVAGTLAITDVTVSDPSAAAVGGISGGSINITFSDLTKDGGMVVSGTTSVGGCVVTQFDPTHKPNPQLDAGAISFTDVPDGANGGLNSTVGPCTLQLNPFG